jgi:DNA polymerase III sliding clamp (beta) subunit (PCNA family)
MKMPKDCLVEKVCSKDATRFAINAPFLDIKEGNANLISTNGRAIVIIPVQVGPEDAQGYIPIDGLKAARKAVRGKGGDIEATANGAFALPTGQSFPRNADATFPNWRQVIPAADKPFAFEIGLNASYLLDIVQALGGTGNVRLSFTGPHDAISIRAMDGPLKYEEAAKAVLMPVRIT